MPDRELTELLDRAVHDAPPMHLSGEAMLAAGKGRVRRRRAVGVGAVAGALALVAAVWAGPGGGLGPLTGTPDIQPATSVWEPGKTVEGTLFSGLQTVDGEQVAHSYAAELSRTSGEGPVTLVLSDGGGKVEEVVSTSPVPGLDVFAGTRMTVAVWVEPDGVTASVPLVGPYDPGGPADVQHAEVDGEELAYSVWSADVVPLPEEVLDVYLVGRDGAVALSGSPMQWVTTRAAGHHLRGFVDQGRGVLGQILDDEAPVLTQAGDRPAQVVSSGAVSSDGVETLVALLPVGAEVEGAADGFAGWSRATVLDRPLVLLVREDATADDPVDLDFTLGGESWTLTAYTQDLRELGLADGTSVTVLPGDVGERLGLGDADADVPRVTFGDGEDAGPALATRPVGGSLVTVVEGWDTGAGVLADTRVEVTQDGAARWVVPTDVAQVSLDDGRLVTLLAVDAVDRAEVTAVGRVVDGDVERWAPPVAAGQDGVSWDEADGLLVPSVDGAPLEAARIGSIGDARVYPLPDGREDLLVLPAGIGADDTVVPLQRKDTSSLLDPAPWLLDEGRVVQSDAGPVRVFAVPHGFLGEGVQLAVRRASAVEEEAANVWGLLGSARSGHMVIDGGLVVSVGGSGPDDVWLLYPAGDDSETGALHAGVVGAVLDGWQWPGDELRYQLVAVLPVGSTPQLVLEPGAISSPEGEGEAVLEGPVDGLEVWTATVRTGPGALPHHVDGLDLDGDGEPDLRLPHRG